MGSFPAPQPARSDTEECGCELGALATAPFPFRTGQVSPAPPLTSLVSPSPPRGFTLHPSSLSYQCAHTQQLILAAPSPVRMCPPHLHAHPTQLWGYKLPSDVSRTQSYTHPITRSCTQSARPITHSFAISPTVTVTGLRALSHSGTCCLSHTHTAAPTAACTHKHPGPTSHAWARPGSPAGPPPRRVAR